MVHYSPQCSSHASKIRSRCLKMMARIRFNSVGANPSFAAKATGSSQYCTSCVRGECEYALARCNQSCIKRNDKGQEYRELLASSPLVCVSGCHYISDNCYGESACHSCGDLPYCLHLVRHQARVANVLWVEAHFVHPRSSHQVAHAGGVWSLNASLTS